MLMSKEMVGEDADAAAAAAADDDDNNEDGALGSIAHDALTT
jgi:hypothetical protein